MRKSIFFKYFSMCAVMILGSITILGAVLLLFSSQYFKYERYSLLRSNAVRAAETVQNDSLFPRIGVGPLTQSALNVLSNAIDSAIYLTNTEGQIIYCPERNLGRPCVHTARTVPKAALEQAAAGEYNETGKLGGIYDKNHYIVAVAVWDYSGNNITGYIFASSAADTLSVFLREILQMFLFSSLGVTAFVFIILYFATGKMTMPLKEMVRVTKKFGRGELSARIGIESEDEIGQLAEALNNMASDLAIQEAVQRNFIANVSHELKTPMTTISGFIDGILDGVIEPSKQETYLRIVSDEVRRLSRLVSSMLNISKIEAGEYKLNAANFDIHETVVHVVINFEQLIESKAIDIIGLDREKLTAYGDRDLIHQVIYNLVENAIKFTNHGGTIEFIFGHEANSTTVAIRNTGQGLSKMELSLIFDRFYKTDKSRSLDKKGIGLGLFIVKSIMKMHSGDIQAFSTEGSYTEIKIALPDKRKQL
ncbi:MAG: HAMP domain-containing histidine kinase [Oscillospiraceae bacterium]|nr:HAMP domain-containing histidine kinase [Oscillospiraceae bacterium]